MGKGRKKYAPTAGGSGADAVWQRFLALTGWDTLTTAGATLTAALIGLLGVFVNAHLIAAAQPGAVVKQKHEAVAAQEVTVNYGEFLEDQRKFVFGAVKLIGRCVSASDGLIALTDPTFDPARYKGIESQRLEMRKKFNDCASQWNEEYNELSLGMSYYHGGQPAIVGGWGEVQQATTGFMGCAHQWYVNHNTAPVVTADACKTEKDELKRRLADFNLEVGAARRHAWQQRQAPGPAVEAGQGNKPGQVGLVEQ